MCVRALSWPVEASFIPRRSLPAIADKALDGGTREHCIQQFVEWLPSRHQTREAFSLWRPRGGVDEVGADGLHFPAKQQRLRGDVSRKAWRETDSL